MPKKRSWTDDQLIDAVTNNFSYRTVLISLQLVPAGGNYEQIKKRIEELNIDVTHFTGKRWNVGVRRRKTNFGLKIQDLLVENSHYQSHKLKKRLFSEGLKEVACEICGWAERSIDGRIPVELDHINGNHYDNRLINLRILCPNCHSLQATHRGRNKKTALINKNTNILV